MKKITAWMLVLMLMLINVPMYSLAAEKANTSEELEAMIQETSGAMKEISGSEQKNVLSDTVNFPAGSGVCDWAAVAWAFSGEEEDYETYLSSLEQYVTDCYAANGCIDERKVTESQRIALTVSALGGNPEAVGTDQDGNAINLVADGTYRFYRLVYGDTAAETSDNDGKDGMGKDTAIEAENDAESEKNSKEIQALGKQGINGYIYALLLLDSKNYEIPEGEAVTREGIVNALLAAQLEDGGFALGAGGEASVDITAMTLQALAPYQDQEEVKNATEKGIDWLGEQMSDYGAFEYQGEASSEASSQVILAMSALGVDITKEERLIKNGMTVLDGLNLFRLDDGSYMHSMSEGTSNLMATEQALLALNALKKCQDQEGRLYDFSSYEAPGTTEGASLEIDGIMIGFLVAVTAAILLIIVAFVVGRKRK